MKVINRTAYATIGCDVQLSENDRLALGIELDKISNWLDSIDAILDPANTPEETIESIKAINKIVAFISKFAIRPSQSNVFTDSTEEFKKAVEQADETTTVVESDSAEDNVVTVDISDLKDKTKLRRIIYNATDANLMNIDDLFNSVKKEHISCISFKCTEKSKIEVIIELVSAGCMIGPNTDESLQLETYMVSH